MERISKGKSIELIYGFIEQGKTFSDSCAEICGKFRLSERAFLNHWNEAKAKYEKKREKIEKAKTTREISRQLHELETKDGQVDALIKQANQVAKELESGMTVEYTWVRSEYVQTERPLNANERKDRRQIYYKLLAEIRAIRGLDAPKTQNLNVKTDLQKMIEDGDAIPEDPIPVDPALFPKIS